MSKGRTKSGHPTAQERKKSGRKDGSFPIWDKESADSAIKLRGHEHDAKKRQAIINRAAKYDPKAAEKARKKDRKSK